MRPSCQKNCSPYMTWVYDSIHALVHARVQLQEFAYITSIKAIVL